MTLEGLAQKIIKRMQSEGKVTTLSKESSAKIDHEFELEFSRIKQEFEQKHMASRTYASDLESGRINFQKPNNFYQKVRNYFSNILGK